MSLPATSIFAQLLQFVPAATFERLVRKHRHEAGAKGFSSWQQFVAMLFMQLGQAHSLREIELGLGSLTGKLGHLGLSAPPARSTLAYTNEHRSWQLYEDLFQVVLAGARDLAQQRSWHRLPFKKRLFSIDATTIDLCAETFNWAKFRRTKGAVKLHLTLDHQGCLPCYAVITEGRQHEATVARTLEFPAGSIVAMDRGYVNYGLFADWTRQGVDFVTRQKSSAAVEVVEERTVPEGGDARPRPPSRFHRPGPAPNQRPGGWRVCSTSPQRRRAGGS
ncbi:MAG: IS4 family transposase, partial [Terriglobia bacterium]